MEYCHHSLTLLARTTRLLSHSKQTGCERSNGVLPEVYDAFCEDREKLDGITTLWKLDRTKQVHIFDTYGDEYEYKPGMYPRETPTLCKDVDLDHLPCPNWDVKEQA